MDILLIVAIAAFILFWFLSEQNRDRARNRALHHDHSFHHWFHNSDNHDSFSSDSVTDFGCNDSSFDGGGCDTDF